MATKDSTGRTHANQQRTAERPAPAGQPAAPAVRRRLAENVICLFPEDRPPVVQHQRRGRFPREVAPLWRARARRLRVGALCQIRNPDSSNHGLFVVIDKPDGKAPPDRVDVATVSGPYRHSDGDETSVAYARAQDLHRVSPAWLTPAQREALGLIVLRGARS